MKSIVAVIAVALLVACVNADSRFQGKNVLVTGGSSGIGLATALKFAQEGASVIIAARDSDTTHYSLQKAADTINNDATVKAAGGKCRSFKADLTKATDVKNLFDDIVSKENGLLHLAVNAAGISGPLGKIVDTAKWTGTERDPILNNYYATLRSVTEEEYLMNTNGINGVIVNVISFEGIIPSTSSPLYAASKFASVGLSNSVGLLHAPNTTQPYIRVVGVAPGPTNTPLLRNRANFFAFNKQPWEGEFQTEDSKTWKEYEANVSSSIPMARVAKPDEIANTILWLCTEDAVHISATTVMADGGIWAV